MKITLLGTGSSTGTPQLLCKCPVCLSDNEKNMRTRFSIFLETGQKNILIDTPFEIRLQLLRAGVESIDAIWLTHAHSDHFAGIDDMRVFSFKNKAPIPFFSIESTLRTLEKRFEYLFFQNEYSPVSFLEAHAVTGSEHIFFSGMEIIPICYKHGPGEVTSFRTGDFAFVVDVSAIAESELEKLYGLELLVISATTKRDHYKHLKLDDIVEIAKKLAPKRVVLTHMNHTFDYTEIRNYLPSFIEPGYDNMVIEI